MLGRYADVNELVLLGTGGFASYWHFWTDAVVRVAKKCFVLLAAINVTDIFLPVIL